MAAKQVDYAFTSKKVSCFFDTDFLFFEQLVKDKKNTIIITDENVFAHHQSKFEGWKVIVIKAGEEYKQQPTVDFIINELIKHQADRKTFIVGIGGGVVTDITGYAASVYMRGVKFGFIPTTILAMVDASIGGKNGIDVGLYKNLVGTIRQPDFLLYDYSFLNTLPHAQWVNGFAEIIKHACIKDADLFSFLEDNSIESFKKSKEKLINLIEKNVQIKTAIVLEDEFESGNRKLLNFGHTFGHAIENEYKLLHGHAVSIGMVMAASISEEINDFYSTQKQRLIRLIEKYELPASIPYDAGRIMEIMLLDKKKESQHIHYILLDDIGKAVIKPIPVAQLEDLITVYQ